MYEMCVALSKSNEKYQLQASQEMRGKNNLRKIFDYSVRVCVYKWCSRVLTMAIRHLFSMLGTDLRACA